MLNTVKLLLGISSLDTSKDEILNAIISVTEDKLKGLTGLTEISTSLSFVVIEVAICRFNRLGSEGFINENVDGISTTYKNDDSDFTPYLSQIRKHTGTGKFRFL